jgi:hypothetical protein
MGGACCQVPPFHYMTAINYHNKVFKGVENYDSGDLNPETRFYYYQEESTVWGNIDGGRLIRGSFIAKADKDGCLDMVWQYLSSEGKFICGNGRSTPELLPDGRIRLHEEWEITTGPDVKGRSTIEEVK